jgi:hypothetical protein
MIARVLTDWEEISGVSSSDASRVEPRAAALESAVLETRKQPSRRTTQPGGETSNVVAG